MWEGGEISGEQESVSENIQTLPGPQCEGGTRSGFPQEESEDSECFRKARPPGMEQGGGRPMS